jgi:site-specific recombinase XerC
MITDPVDGQPGLRIESAASVIARDFITKHVNQFAHVLVADRAASQSTTRTYIDGLAAVVALAIAGRQGSRDEIVGLTLRLVREAIDRDLQVMGRK